MQYHSEVLNFWESPRDLAGDLGKDPDVVRKWFERESIPSHALADVVQACSKRNYPVDIQKLISIKRKRKRKTQ